MGLSRKSVHKWISRCEAEGEAGLSVPAPYRGFCAAMGCPLCTTCDPMTGALIRASKSTAVRYERARPGELVHMDVNTLGRGIGIGFDYVHSLVDDHSRLAYSEILPDEKGLTCAAFLRRGHARKAEKLLRHRGRNS